MQPVHNLLYANLKKIRGEIREKKELKQKCDQLLANLDQRQQTENNEPLVVDEFINPFLLACKSKLSKNKKHGLNAIADLIGYGFFKGDKVINVSKGITLMDVTIGHITSLCSDSDHSVQLLVIRALSAAISSINVDIHDDSIINVARALFWLYVNGANSNNKNGAKSLFQQYVIMTIAKMENREKEMITNSSTNSCPIEESEKEHEDGKEGSDKEEEEEGKEESKDTENKNDDDVIDDAKETREDERTEEKKKENNTDNNDKEDKPITLESVEAKLIPGGKDLLPTRTHEDVFTLFEELCRVADLRSTSQNTSLDCQLLAMDLLRSMIENAGKGFRSYQQYLGLIREKLCSALLRNCLAHNRDVVKLSLRTFLQMFRHFKDHLKAGVGVFITDICVRYLESDNTPREIKTLVMDVFYQIFQDGRLVLELFLNYDCDMDSPRDLIDQMIGLLTKIVNRADDKHQKQIALIEARENRVRALRCTVRLFKSLQEVVEFALQRDGDEDENDDDINDIDINNNNNSMDIDDCDKSVASSVTMMSTVTDMMSAAVVSHEQKLRLRQDMQHAATLFKEKPRNGIAYLVKKGYGNDSAEGIAKMLFQFRDQLSKTAIGDYMGNEKEFNISVLHAYVDNLSFENMKFCDSVRLFLSGFRLPGEGQKVDRFMEKFAERYCSQNPDVFPSAETAFVLAFSLIMLQTDAHNPNIPKERKMKEDEFIRNNRGIADGKDMPPEMLSEMYQDIVGTPITLAEDDKLRAKLQANAPMTRRQRQMKFSEEKSDIMKLAEEAMENLKTEGIDGKKYVTVDESVGLDHVRPLVALLWDRLLAVCGVMLEDSSTDRVTDICLEGFKCGVFLSSICRMDTETEAFVSSLTKFTSLQYLREMSRKNIKCIRSVLDIALSFGNLLGSSWSHIIQCISQLQRFQMFTTGVITDAELFGDQQQQDMVGGERIQGIVHSLTSPDLINFLNSLPVDKVFMQSTCLDSEAIIDFVTQLVEVSSRELMLDAPLQAHKKIEHQPRMFCLEKVVVTADVNMASRSRLVWQRVWKHLAKHMGAVGCHPNTAVALNAIDSLKQLSLKFLEKSELRDFSFQREFLRPFEDIMANTDVRMVRELVLQCVNHLILTRVDNIKSGWKSVVSVLKMAATDSHHELVEMTFDLAQVLLDQYLELLTDCFPDLVRCLIECARNKFESLSIQAIERIRRCADRLVLMLDLNEDQLFEDTEEHIKPWWPILTGLAELVGDQRDEVRNRALEVLFHILSTHGGKFSATFWEMVLKGVVFPLFDDTKHPMQFMDSDWLQSTCLPALQSLINLFVNYFPNLEFMLSDMLEMLGNSVRQNVEPFARVGVDSLQQLMVSGGNKFSSNHWNIALRHLDSLFVHTTPTQLFKNRTAFAEIQELFALDDDALHKDSRWTRAGTEEEIRPSSLSIEEISSQQPSSSENEALNVQQVYTQCVVQLELIHLVDHVIIAHENRLEKNHFIIIVEMLERSARFAELFNADNDLRDALLRSGFMKSASSRDSKRPTLVRQQNQAMRQVFDVLIRLETASEPAPEGVQDFKKQEFAEELLPRLCESCVEDFLRFETELLAQQGLQSPKDNEGAVTLQHLAPVVVKGLTAILYFSEELFKKSLPWIFNHMTKLWRSENREIRAIASEIFMKRFGGLLSIPVASEESHH